MKWTLFPATGFATHAARWQQLNSECGASPLLHPDFVGPLLTEFGDGKELLACCEGDGQVLAMGIVQPGRAGVWSSFQPSQAPLGIWLDRAGLDIDAATAGLMRKLPGFPLLLGLTQRDPMLAPRPGGGATLQTIDYVDTARITIRGTFDEYWNGRGKNLRTNLKKQRTKLQKDGIAPRLEVSRAPEEVAPAIAAYGRLESAGWKAGGGTAIHQDNAQGRFYRTMLEAFCRRGKGRILRYWFGDQLVAMNLCIESDDRLVILKTTYDEGVSRQFSPAFLMLEETCQQLFEEQKFATLEFYGKVMEWHTRWTDEVRTLYHVNNYRWPALLQLRKLMNNRAAAQPVQQDAPSTE